MDEISQETILKKEASIHPFTQKRRALYFFFSFYSARYIE